MGSNSIKRRTFLKTAIAGYGLTIVPRHVLGRGIIPPSEKLNIASVGIGGQGGGLLGDAAFTSQNIVALCDCDERRTATFAEKFPGAALYHDYRELLDKQKDIDAVVVATPDHMHAPVALAAMRAGKHVYVEKPMAHSIEEARVMARVAKETGLVTQMGNNGHAGEGIRQTREWIQAGAIGLVREVHCWSDRPGTYWPQPAERPADMPEVPEGMHWDLWLGGAPRRPYNHAYAPFRWRGWFDFGTGALGDMAVHNLDPAFYALDLGAPTATEAHTSPLGAETFPAWEIITYEYAATARRTALKLFWYDGGKKPAPTPHMNETFAFEDNGILFLGEKGTMLCGGWSGGPRLFPESLAKGFTPPAPTIPRSPGHRAEWVAACKAGKPEDAKAGFAYSGPFTEALLVGNLAVRLKKRIEWDAAAMKATNAPEADGLIRKSYANGIGI